jgi:CxxC motif-containing protein
VTATCAIVSPGENGPRRVPVKTNAPCPRERIPELLKDIYTLSVRLPVQTGDVMIAGWKGTGIDVVAARTLACVPSGRERKEIYGTTPPEAACAL